MANLGTATILIALLLTAYSVLTSFVGAKRGDAPAVVSAQRANYLTTLTLAVSMGALVYAFLENDFSIRYVAENSNLAMPRIYTWVAFYAGNAGSLLYVAFALSGMAALSMALAPRRLGALRPYANGVLMLILLFFLVVLFFLANPFATLERAPADGQGINPLLTHPGMFAHPPLIMTGLVAIAVPFSLAVSALLRGRIDDDWVDAGRVWGLAAWVLLAIGLLLGSWWAYTILGWGGYWAWDPVENAAFMPWLALTAFIHSIMVQKRRGMFRMWNIALINISFTLGAFGIFINRGGPVPSVHSFGASTLGWVFLTFLGVVTVASFALFFYRMAVLRSPSSLESALSREAAFLVNNLLLLGIAFVTLWGVVFPLISELATGRTITVGEPFFNSVNGPLMLALILLMGIGPLLPWRTATWQSVRRALFVPGVITLVITAAATLLFLVTVPVVVLGIAVSTFAGISILQEWVRGLWPAAAPPARCGPWHSGNWSPQTVRATAATSCTWPWSCLPSASWGLRSTTRSVMCSCSVGDQAAIGEYTVEFMDVSAETFADRTERTAILNVDQRRREPRYAQRVAGGLPVVLHDLDPGGHTLYAPGRPLCDIQRTAAGWPDRGVPPVGESHGLVDVARRAVRHPRHHRRPLARSPTRGCVRDSPSAGCCAERRRTLGGLWRRPW